MAKYLLSVHSVEGEVGDPMTEGEMQQFMKAVGILEEEMKSAGAWVFGGALHEPDTATVVRMSDGEVLTTDGPFAESKEHLGGFYIIEAANLDAALVWVEDQRNSITPAQAADQTLASPLQGGGRWFETTSAHENALALPHEQAEPVERSCR